VSQQSQQAPQVPVELPESTLEAQQTPVDDFVVAIDEAGRILIGADELVSVEELAVRLAKAADENPNTVVLVRGDQTVPYGRVAQVMAMARLTGLKISAVLKNR